MDDKINGSVSHYLLDSNLPREIPSGILAVGCISSCLSIFGAIVIFVSYAKLPEIRNFTRKLLVYLTIADLLTAIGYLTGIIRYSALQHQGSSATDGLCVAQSFAIIYTNLSSFLWTIVIALHIYISYACQTDFTSRRIPHVAYHIICWGLPGIVATTAALSNVLGEDNIITPTPWCFVRGDMGHERYLYWVLGVTVVWEFLTYIFTSFLYINLKFLMCRRSRRLRVDILTTGLRPEDRNYVCVWLILYILKVWATIRDFIVIFKTNITAEDKDVLFGLLICQCLFDSAQAFANFILFCVCDGIVRKGFFRCNRLTEESQALLDPNL